MVLKSLSIPCAFLNVWVSAQQSELTVAWAQHQKLEERRYML